MSRFEKVQVREAPALFCAQCREWKRASLAEIIAAYTVPALRSFWECAGCRPEGLPTHPPVTPLKKERKIKGLRTNFEGIGGRRKGRSGRPRRSPSKASLDGRARRS